MKTYKQLVSEIYSYPPTTQDEKNFINMHTVKSFDYPVKNEHGLPFRDDRIKSPGPQHKKLSTYDPPKEPTTVYTKANEEVVDEKTLTPAEKRKREEVAKAIERENPGMPMPMKMAIATKTAKRVAENSGEDSEVANLRLLLGLNPNAGEEVTESFDYDDMLSILALVSDTDQEVEIFFEDSEEGLIIDKEVADLLLSTYDALDEESRAKFEAALTLSNESFDYCVDFGSSLLSEEDDNDNS